VIVKDGVVVEGGSVREAVVEGVVSVREPVQAAVSNDKTITTMASLFIYFLFIRPKE
jgi:hypothetical protein